MGDACAFIDGVSVIDKTRRQTARGLIPDLLRCMQGIQRVARDRSRDVSDSLPPAGLGREMLSACDVFGPKDGRVREEDRKQQRARQDAECV